MISDLIHSLNLIRWTQTVNIDTQMKIKFRTETNDEIHDNCENVLWKPSVSPR